MSKLTNCVVTDLTHFLIFLQHWVDMKQNATRIIPGNYLVMVIHNSQKNIDMTKIVS